MSSFFSSFSKITSGSQPATVVAAAAVGTGKSVVPLPATDALKVVMVLDESGSMINIKEKMRQSINEFITNQQKEKVDGTTFTLVKFSDNVETVIDNVPINLVKLLEPKDYVPTGSTALFDAVGLTIDRFRQQPAVVMVIVTDGAENVSRYYTDKKGIASLISKYKTEKKWNFVYLSCDIDTFDQGETMGYASSAQSSNVRYEKAHMGSFIGSSLSKAVSCQRATGQTVNQTLNSAPEGQV